MRNLTAIGRHAGRMVCTTRFLLATSVLLISSSAFAQQSYVGRFDAYAGYMYLDSPHIKLAENGFHTQVAVSYTHLDVYKRQNVLRFIPTICFSLPTYCIAIRILDSASVQARLIAGRAIRFTDCKCLGAG